ncbi:MAG: ACT domain-containing protein [Verrucomicrobiales bacterium]|jgi:glycine cleavage system regulatory protein|nr:ACT domain-containing protein [Verrucomicrobiales bacterium]
MNHYLVMTIIGPDRPGLVDNVASLVREHGGNWLESRMCKLGGQFAGILRVEIDANNEVPLLAALQKLESQNIAVIANPETANDETADIAKVSIELIGQDRPGIVSEITKALARHKVNVEELTTERLSAPMSAEPLFQASATLHIPAGTDIPALRADLETITSELMVDMIFGKPARA